MGNYNILRPDSVILEFTIYSLILHFFIFFVILSRIERSWSAKKLDKEKFTIIILTHGRTDVLLTLLGRYVRAVSDGKLPQLSKVLIVWNNVHTPPPTEKWKALGPHSIPVIFLQQKENRLTNRFRVFPQIDTEGGIEIVQYLML